MIEESVPRIKASLQQLSEAEIWQRPNEQTVSVGNLVLHLCGNVRQWILTGLGGQPDTRQRSEEFSEPGPLPAEKLIRDLDSLMAAVDRVLAQMTPEQWVARRTVQGFDETGIGILIHVVEHFSYHTGQIVYAVKSRKNVDLKFYTGIDLDQTSP